MQVVALNGPGRLLHKISIALIIFVLALASSAIHASEEGGGSTGVIDGEVNYVPLEPAFVVNILDGNNMRFMQLELNLMSIDSHAIQAVQEHHAPISHELLMLFAHRDLSEALGLEQRELLRKEALKRIQDVLIQYAGISSKDQATIEDDKKIAPASRKFFPPIS